MAELFEGTIAAISTAPGRAAVAVVRLSGTEAGEILLRVAPALRGSLPEPRRQRLLPIEHPESRQLLDRALVSWFPGPRSYTGEDTVEIASHGGVLSPQLVLDALLAAGARPARAGEFTHRAVHNGKLDLLQAEAVLDLIDGRSRALHRAAVNQLERGLSHRIDQLRHGVLQVEALATYGIDFPEEDEPPVPAARIRQAADDVVSRIRDLLATAHQGELLREGALVVLAGEPNSGKSSLFNALLGFERAIVTDVPGTTRDALEGFAELGGYPFRLVDTAGLRETADRVEGIGIEVARRYLSAADLVVFCVPGGRALNDGEEEFRRSLSSDRLVIVRTMADLLPEDACPTGLRVSAATGLGLGELSASLVERAYAGLVGEPDEAPLVTRERHARALRAAVRELELFGEVSRAEVPMELAATHLRAAADALEEIIGVLSPDDLLGHLFGQFCIGK